MKTASPDLDSVSALLICDMFHNLRKSHKLFFGYFFIPPNTKIRIIT